MPFYPFLGEGSPIKIDERKKGTLILTSLLEDLAESPTFGRGSETARKREPLPKWWFSPCLMFFR